MKVFISWSGERSRLVAEALRYWLPKIIQTIQPWMSANDIEKGTQWRAGITNELEQSSVGIICLTPENLESPWIHFEAGALSKQRQNTRVCTFLYDLDPVDIREPLAQFQTTKASREDVRKLIQTINNARIEDKLAESEMNEIFDVWWPKLEQRLSTIPNHEGISKQRRSERDILEEVLELVRSLTRPTSIPASTPLRVEELFSELVPDVISGVGLSEDVTQLLTSHLNISEEEVKNRYFTKEFLIGIIDGLLRKNPYLMNRARQ